MLQIIPDQRDYNAIIRAIEIRYSDEHMQEVFRLQLKTRQQKTGETLQELAADIKRLFHLAYPSAGPEFMGVMVTDAFTDAIRNPELRKAVRVSGKRNSSEALVYALSYEAAKESSKNIHYNRQLDVEKDDQPQPT